MDSLSTRLNSLRELHDTEIATKEARAIEFPLWALLTIYEKANRTCYPNYFEGFKLLRDWLNPIAITTIPNENSPYNHRLLQGYESEQLARHLNTTMSTIIDCTLHEVLDRNILSQIK